MPIPVIITILRSQAAGPYVSLSFRQALTASLKDNAALTAIVGQRIYPQVLPTNATLPALTYMVVTNIPLHNLAGAAGITSARVEFKAYSSLNADCDAILQILRNQFDGFNGGFPGSVLVVETLKKLEYDHWDPPASQSGYGTYMQMNDYLIRYRESIPTL